MMKPTPEEIAAIRRLDVEWAHRYFTKLTGHPFQAAHSEDTGAWFEADEVALLALHRLRATLGSKAEAKASKEWLRARGLKGVFGQSLDLS